MKTITMLTVLTVLASVPAAAQHEETRELAISAFADLLLPAETDEDTGGQFRINQAEIDLEGTIKPGANAAMALAYDPEAETFALAVMAVEYTLAGGDGLNAALMAGRFDVRFGVDWRVYASIDRRFVTPPLMINGTHEGWNDLGANLNLGLGALQADLFVLNGGTCGRGIQTAKLDRADVKRAFGGRVGATFGAIEAGVSGAACHDLDDRIAQSLFGVDLQASTGRFALRGEYVVQRVDQSTPFATRTEGWYVQGICDLDRFFGFARWDGIDPEAKGADKPLRWSLGGGCVVEDGLELRLEHEMGVRALPNRTWLQLAVSFGVLGG